MCGIAGVLHLDGAPADPQILGAMTRILAHRGPDGEGVRTDGAVGLGHRRLSIVDLSANGAQPMSNEDDSLWITYNGEVYNHMDLRPALESNGHIFRSRSDTEAILHGYEAYGAAVVERLNGMFAFAIWDRQTQSLFLARDRIGIKPLFYAIFDDVLLFGSEIKAILQHPASRRELDEAALDIFLSTNYTPAPYTMLRGVRQLLPGQWLRAQVGSREVQTQTFWDVDYSQKTALSQPQAEEQFAALLQESVQRRLMADVPFGAFLSGGLDSSSVAACMALNGTELVKTFAIGFHERSYNEAPYARAVAEHLGTQHHERIVTPDLADTLPKIVWHAEDPLADPSMLPVYYLAQMTREHVTVALAGDGADEILAGYPTYIATQWARRVQFVPQRLAQAGAGALAHFVPLSDGKIPKREKLLRFARGAGLPWQDAHAVWRQIHTPQQKRQVLTNGIGSNGHARLLDLYHQYYARSGAVDMLDQLLYVDTRFYLPNDMLVKVDRMTMAHGLEARVPFLDHELVEFAASLPSDFKLRDGVGKYILRRAMAKHLPALTLKRPKEGFNIPVGKWLRGELNALLHESLAPHRLKAVGVFDAAGVQKMISAHEKRQQDNGYPLWGLLNFMLWWEQFMTKTAEPSP